MEKVIAYDIIEATTSAELSEQVNSAISRGWVPSGVVVRGDGCWLQAVVKFS